MRDVSRNVSTTQHRGKIRVLQFNCGSLTANLHEIISRLVQQRPDVVLIQETNLNPERVVKLDGYAVARK